MLHQPGVLLVDRIVVARVLSKKAEGDEAVEKPWNDSDRPIKGVPSRDSVDDLDDPCTSQDLCRVGVIPQELAEVGPGPPPQQRLRKPGISRTKVEPTFLGSVQETPPHKVGEVTEGLAHEAGMGAQSLGRSVEALPIQDSQEGPAECAVSGKEGLQIFSVRGHDPSNGARTNHSSLSPVGPANSTTPSLP